MKRIEHLRRYRPRGGGRHDNYGSVLAAHPDSRRGGHLQTAGSQPIMLRGLPNPRLPEAPGIRNAPTLRQRPDDAETPPAQFHLPTTGTGRIEPRLNTANTRTATTPCQTAPTGSPPPTRPTRRTHPRIHRSSVTDEFLNPTRPS